jgi:N-acetylglucosaminyl-diphospho-decaprenol L-rhamnosyltransferase
VLAKLSQNSSTAVIIHWGDPRPTVDVALRYDREGHFSKVVIVANDLQARPSELRGSGISWVIPPRNLGFGGGCNLGAYRYPAEKYVFLNADVTFHPNAISMCMAALDMPQVGISAPALYFPDGKLQSGCGTISRRMRIPRCDTPPSQSISECEWVTGASLFCRHEVIESIGFDGSYFLSYEDLDIAYRAKLAGWKVVVVSGATATHPSRTTLNGARPIYYGIRNPIWFSRRHTSFLGSIAMTLYALRKAPRVMLADAVKRRSPHTLLMLHGLLAGWGTLPNTKEPLLGEPIPSRWINWHA